MIENIADELLKKIDEKGNPCCVGLDPVVEKIPPKFFVGDSFDDIAFGFTSFNYWIIDAICDLVPCVKPQIAFYEAYGVAGLVAFKATVDYARRKGLIVIEDGKRADIGSTSEAYANGHLGVVRTSSGEEIPSLNVDLLTINPYLGSDGLTPFVEVCKNNGKGVFILAKTSNPSSGEYQDRLIEINEKEEREFDSIGIKICDKRTQLYNLVALNVNKYAQKLIGKRGYSPIGAVVGATYPEQAIALRKIMPNSIFLVPGYGVQGATAKDIINCFNNDGYGAVVNASRSIIYSSNPREATMKMIIDINTELRNAGKIPKY